MSNVHIDEYKEGSYNNHEPKRLRKLLLKKTELRKLLSKTKEKGLTIVPVKMFITDRGFAKIHIALAKGKKREPYDVRRAASLQPPGCSPGGSCIVALLRFAGLRFGSSLTAVSHSGVSCDTSGLSNPQAGQQ